MAEALKKLKIYSTHWHVMHLPVIGSQGPPLHGHFKHFDDIFVGIP